LGEVLWRFFRQRCNGALVPPGRISLTIFIFWSVFGDRISGQILIVKSRKSLYRRKINNKNIYKTIAYMDKLIQQKQRLNQKVKISNGLLTFYRCSVIVCS